MRIEERKKEREGKEERKKKDMGQNPANPL